MSNQHKRRVLGRIIARELSAEEIANVSGACPEGTPTTVLPGGDLPGTFNFLNGRPVDVMLPEEC